jgi:hypothetical protein
MYDFHYLKIDGKDAGLKECKEKKSSLPYIKENGLIDVSMEGFAF